MTSPTDKTERKRAAKKASSGRVRKNLINKKGSTAELFTLNKPVPGPSAVAAQKK